MTNKLEQIENSIRWIAALSSNKHSQGKSILGDEKLGFCCLGLACHINGFDYEPKNPWLSHRNMEELGLENKMGKAIVGSRLAFSGNARMYFSLVDANDDAGLTFPEIAEVIIENAEYLFIPEVAKGVTDYFSNY